MKRKIYYIGLLLFCLTSFFQKSTAQNIQVDARLDTSSILLGDQTILRLRARFPAAEDITFPKLADTLGGKIQVVHISNPDTTLDKDNSAIKIITRDYTVTSFDTGYHAIPAFIFRTKNDSLKTSDLRLQVIPVAVDTSKSIYDIKQPLAVSYTWLDWLRDNWKWIFFGIMILLAIIGAINYFRKTSVPQIAPVKQKPVIPAHQIALDKLNGLRNKQLWQQDEVKQYHSELSDIIREYLENRYQINALEQTTEEIFAALKHKKITNENRNLLRRMLTLADLVKFAKEKPDGAVNEQSMEKAVNFVTDTQETIVAPEK
ncbi:MAG: hypothetical protein ACOH2A_14110 [Sphingobacteriaceae bacterium]